MTRLTATAAIGWAPFVIALAIVIMSGVTPKDCAAKAWPVRPKPVMTSSNTSKMPFWVQISLSQYPSRAGDRLDEASGDVLGPREGNETLKVFGQLRSMFGLTPDEAEIGIPCVPHMNNTSDARPIGAAVWRHPRQSDPTEIDAVIGALPRHEHRPSGLTACPVIGEADLHRGFDRLGSGIGEEYTVEPRRRQLGDRACRLECARMATGEAGHIVESHQLVIDGLGDFGPAMPSRTGEQARATIEDRRAVFAIVKNT